MSESADGAKGRMISAGHINGIGSSGDNAEIHSPTVNLVYNVAGQTLSSGSAPGVPAPRADMEGPSPRNLVTNLGPRNAGFVGREAAFQEIRRLLGSHGRVVTRPRDRMGGVGKTQLAIEYAYRSVEDYDAIWLIPSENEQLVGGHMAQLSVSLGLVDPSTTTPAAVQALHKEIAKSTRWLLIFDNAEEPGSLAAWLPPRGGRVIITSRHPGWDEIAAPVEVPLFTRAESTKLLVSRVPHLPHAEADRLAEALGDLPLAVAQAASVMTETGMGASAYLELLSDQAAEILAAGSPSTYKTSLTATVKLSMDRLRQSYPAADQLLRLCSVLAPEPIPMGIFIRSMDLLPVPLSSVGRNRIAFFDVVKALGENGLAGVSSDGIQLHRLIQAIVKDDAKEHELQAAADVMAQAISAFAPQDTDDPANWHSWSVLAPHIIALKPEAARDGQLRKVACELVLYLLRRAESKPALDIAEVLFNSWNATLGSDNVHTLRAATEYAHALYICGDYESAHRLTVDTFGRYQRVLGDDHPDTLRSANDLAVTLNNFGELDADLSLSEDTLARCKRVLGEDHPDTLRATISLAATLQGVGRYREACALKQKALEGSRRVLGEDHPNTLRAGWALSQTLYSLDELDEDRELSQATFEGTKRVLGEDHPDTLRAACSLGMSMAANDETDDAASLLKDTLERCHRAFGDNHLDTLGALSNLSSVLHELGEYDEALRLKSEAYAGYRRMFGEKHLETVGALLALGNTLHVIGQIPEALEAKKRSLDQFRRKLGDDHPRTLDAANSLAITYCSSGQLMKARALIDEVCRRKALILGPRSLTTKRAFADRRWIASQMGGRGVPKTVRSAGKSRK
ncbi:MULTISPECIES: FxSxx-COOH system tetratricopeptide repeat protein [unclassified Micromonospora]|uniref:FxSxx-COOH system tetratricopeptide repeat protein n=1 Tax=unclassified Micromonospora TaxID=2617518 RepID=UPI001B35B9A9|nr:MULTISPECIES: FxSxx-COOH system tetratricopeptide repeat protein [unclassified Micromonospora]MBQ1044408.1 tetratricopeptide repeat protein [Micromonospora sp. C72]MBQ1056913.1 tetratricopeptide repeat protein [Micromonospora sp. C32]